MNQCAFVLGFVNLTCVFGVHLCLRIGGGGGGGGKEWEGDIDTESS